MQEQAKNENNQKGCLDGCLNINPLYFSGALDVIVVQDSENKLRCSHFFLSISKFKMLYAKDKEIEVFINGKKMELSMKLNHRGIGYFEYQIAQENYAKSSREIGFKDINESYEIENSRLLDEQLKINDNPKIGINKIQSLKDDEPPTPSFLPIKNKFASTKFESEEKIDLNNKQQEDIQQQRRITDLFKKNIKGKRISLGQDILIRISLCENLIYNTMTQEEIQEIFDENEVDLDNFLNNPKKILEKNLMIQINDKIYDKKIGFPQLISLLAYQKPLTKTSLQKILFDERILKNTVTIQSQIPPEQFWDFIKLREGINSLEFKFKGNFGKKFVIQSRLFFYTFRPHFRIVVSDVDGTITRSDVFGHILPFYNNSWTHANVAQLYNNIIDRKYIMVYLTSRNIGQAKRTLQYLEKIKQGKFKMPIGPLITSPDSLFTSINREIIKKNPEEFKIQSLKNLQKLFQFKKYNPIYAGFGNKSTDAFSYLTIGINPKRIFTINPASVIHMINSSDKITLQKILQQIDKYFPQYKSSVYMEENLFQQINNIKIIFKLKIEQISLNKKIELIYK